MSRIAELLRESLSDDEFALLKRVAAKEINTNSLADAIKVLVDLRLVEDTYPSTTATHKLTTATHKLTDLGKHVVQLDKSTAVDTTNTSGRSAA